MGSLIANELIGFIVGICQYGCSQSAWLLYVMKADWEGRQLPRGRRAALLNYATRCPLALLFDGVCCCYYSVIDTYESSVCECMADLACFLTNRER